MSDFSKEFFQRTWGEEGYYETFSYGVGIDKVCEVALYPFLKGNVLEIGSGGGAFTERIIGKAKHLTAIDVIPMPQKFAEYNDFIYIELPDKNYSCLGVPHESIDFCFSYNTFCHLSNEALTKYLTAIHRVLKTGAQCVFMLSNFDKIDLQGNYKLGDLLPMGHFCQNTDTVYLIACTAMWEIVSTNMIPEHRDIIVHLKKI